MQLLCEHTEESNTKGLGIFNTSVKRFSKKVKIPQMGWNTIKNLSHRYLIILMKVIICI